MYVKNIGTVLYTDHTARSGIKCKKYWSPKGLVRQSYVLILQVLIFFFFFRDQSIIVNITSPVQARRGSDLSCEAPPARDQWKNPNSRLTYSLLLKLIVILQSISTDFFYIHLLIHYISDSEQSIWFSQKINTCLFFSLIERAVLRGSSNILFATWLKKLHFQPVSCVVTIFSCQNNGPSQKWRMFLLNFYMNQTFYHQSNW